MTYKAIPSGIGQKKKKKKKSISKTKPATKTVLSVLWVCLKLCI